MREDARAEAAERLDAHGCRATPQRLAVVTALMAQRHAVTAQDLHGVLRAIQPQLGLATVYRALDLLVDCGLAEAFPQPNNEMRYAFCSSTHHHHLVCTHCGLVAEAPGCALRGIERDLERQNNFTINAHTVTFFGTCGDCAAAASAP